MVVGEDELLVDVLAMGRWRSIEYVVAEVKLVVDVVLWSRWWIILNRVRRVGCIGGSARIDDDCGVPGARRGRDRGRDCGGIVDVPAPVFVELEALDDVQEVELAVVVVDVGWERPVEVVLDEVDIVVEVALWSR